MIKKKNQDSSDKLTDLIIKGIQEKKGKNIIQMNLKEVDGAVTDYFIICEANSSTQIGAIKESIEKEVKMGLNEKPWHIEGTSNLEWVLLDYVNVVAHIFNPEKRAFYNVEGLWGDAEIKTFEEVEN